MSHAVARLEDLGWVVRNPCADDKRGSFATLTDEGFAVLERAAHTHVEGVRTHLFDPLTDEEVQQLRTISGKVLAELDTSKTSAPCDETPCDGTS
jgi:DNA-binding MarR family transcriptional regulator